MDVGARDAAKETIQTNEKTIAANEMAKNIAETRAKMDAFMDAASYGGKIQQQSAVRIIDGRVSVASEVLFPATEQRLDMIASIVDVQEQVNPRISRAA